MPPSPAAPRRRPLAACLFMALSAAAGAQGTGEQEPGNGRKPPPLWELGLVAVAGTQPAYPGAEQRTNNAIVLPFLIYRGPFVRAEEGGLNVRAARTPTWELDVGLAGSFGSAASDNDARRGMPDIGLLVEAGPRLKWNLEGVLGKGFGATIPLRAVFDVSNGFEHRGFTLEPTLRWGTRVGRWGLGTNVSLLFGNRRLADTFYGVAPVFATATRPAYQARGGLIATRLGVNGVRRVGEDWGVFSYVRYDSVRGAANDGSPLVDRRGGFSAGVGLAWTFARSDKPGAP